MTAGSAGEEDSVRANPGTLVIGAVALVAGFVALAVLLISTRDDGTGTPSVDLQDDTAGSIPEDAPEFIEAFPPQSPQGDAMDARAICARDGRISWADAEDYVNQRVAVLGPVTGVSEDQTGTAELTLGQTEDETPITVVITATAKRGMPAPPQELYGGEVVCVVGVLQATGTQIKVFVNQPSDISAF